MKPQLLVVGGAVLSCVGLAVGCTTETIVREAPAATPDADAAADDDAAVNPGGDAGSGEDAKAADGKIGTLIEKGTKTVDVNLSSKSSYTCEAVCKAAGGTCEEGGGNGVGWVDRKYNSGGGTFSNRISLCDQSESYASGTTTMTSMRCYCSDMTVDPSVRVRKADGLFTCTKVCASWSMTCSTARSHASYKDEEESSSTKLDCNTVPPAATTHHYSCACDR